MKTCSKCLEDAEKLVKDIPCESMICTKCSQISLTGRILLKNKLVLHKYVWFESIEHKGIEWFRKARDKLIKKQKNDAIIYQKKELARKNKLSKMIDKMRY